MRKSGLLPYLVSIFTPLFLFIAPSRVYAQQSWQSINPLCVSDTDVATIKGLECLFGNILSVALQLLGLTTFIIIIVGGYKYLTSGGDPKATESAQTTITYGILGLVLAIAAWFIIQAIANFAGVPQLLQFNIPTS